MKKSLYYITIALLLAACKKEYRQEPAPYHQITAFQVAYSSKDTLNAVIGNDRIELPWPADVNWPLPDSIAPVIKVSAGATVTPASGKKVALKDGISYTVKAEDGSTQVYTLSIANNGTRPFITELTALELKPGGYTIGWGTIGNLNGNGAKNNMWLVAENGTTYQPIGYYGPQGSYGGNLSFTADGMDGTAIPAGKYRVKLSNGVQTVTSDPVLTITNDPALPYVYETGTSDTLRLTYGQTFTLPVRHLSDGNYTVVDVRLNATRRLTVLGLSADKKGLILQVPDNVPDGVYTSGLRLYLTDKAGNSLVNLSPTYQHPIKIDF